MPDPAIAYGQESSGDFLSKFVSGVNGLTVHLLESGHRGNPVVLLLHGFPELAYSWRKLMPILADSGYHVLAPDLRGYGRTTGWDDGYEVDLSPFRLMGFVQDALALVSALGIEKVHCVVGHDYGSPVAAWCALVRPDVFRRVALMSAPFGGAPRLPFDTENNPQPATTQGSIDDELAALPNPRQHYRWYYSQPDAAENLLGAPQGVHDFLRAYYHFKSADWQGNRPFALRSWAADELAKMPTYYIMERGKGMSETVAEQMPGDSQIEANQWLTEAELAVYSTAYGRTGFQGGLNSYRCGTDARWNADLQVFSGRRIDVPACFIGGAQDWGVYQSPGHLERMRDDACSDLRGVYLIEGAGHWVQQEQPDSVGQRLVEFLAS